MDNLGGASNVASIIIGVVYMWALFILVTCDRELFSRGVSMCVKCNGGNKGGCIVDS